jgi:hypothetical protein
MKDAQRIVITHNTKAKRRVTLSIAGLGCLDESELDTMGAIMPPMPAEAPTVGQVMGVDMTDDAPVEHPSSGEMNALVELARACGIDLMTFGKQMRRLMDLPESAPITRKFLRETMTRAHYDAAWTEYQAMLAKQVEEDVPLGDVPDAPASPWETSGEAETSHPAVGGDDRAATGTPGALKGHQTTQADPIEVKRVMAYAAEHGLGKEFEESCGGDPFQVTAERLRLKGQGCTSRGRPPCARTPGRAGHP